MRKLLMTGCAVLAYVGPAHADQLPLKMQGNWCDVRNDVNADQPEEYGYPATYRRDTRGQKCGPLYFMVVHDIHNGSYHTEDNGDGCELSDVHRIDMDTYAVHESCPDYGLGRTEQDQLWHLDEGLLHIKVN